MMRLGDFEDMSKPDVCTTSYENAVFPNYFLVFQLRGFFHYPI